MNGYIMLAQITMIDGEEKAVGIEKGILDFELTANSLIAHYKDVLFVKMFDNKLNMQGIYYKEKVA